MGDALPPDWTEYFDNNTGKPYYHRAATGETTWTRPSSSGPASGGASTAPSGGGGGGGFSGGSGGGGGFSGGGAGASSGTYASTGPGNSYDSGATQQSSASSGGFSGGGGSQPGGNPQASSPLPAGWTEYKDPATGNPYYHNTSTNETTWTRPAAPASGGGGPAPAPSPMPGPGYGLQSGKVKTWHEDKGFGFVMPDAGGEDVFVHRNTLTDGNMLVAGASVWYEAQWNPQKNKYAAIKCIGASGGTPGTQGGMPGDGGFGGGGGGGGFSAGGDMNRAGPAPGGGGNKQQGTVKSWHEDKGFGFIVVANGENLFVHRSNLADGDILTAGSTVYFEAQYNAQKGKNAAYNVTGASSRSGGGVSNGAPPEPMGMAPSPQPMGMGGGMGGGMGQDANNLEPSNNIFVAGLPRDYNDDRLKALFGAYGSVMDCKVLPDTGKADRAALVRMADMNQSTWCVNNLHGTMPTGHGLVTPLILRFKTPGKGGGKGLGGPMPGPYGQSSPMPGGVMQPGPLPGSGQPGGFSAPPPALESTPSIVPQV